MIKIYIIIKVIWTFLRINKQRRITFCNNKRKLSGNMYIHIRKERKPTAAIKADGLQWDTLTAWIKYNVAASISKHFVYTRTQHVDRGGFWVSYNISINLTLKTLGSLATAFLSSLDASCTNPEYRFSFVHFIPIMCALKMTHINRIGQKLYWLIRLYQQMKWTVFITYDYFCARLFLSRLLIRTSANQDCLCRSLHWAALGSSHQMPNTLMCINISVQANTQPGNRSGKFNNWLT